MKTTDAKFRFKLAYKALVLCLFVLFSSNLFAQFQASVWGGLNSSSFGGNPPEDASYQSIYGVSFGGNLEFKITDDAIISLEPSFEQKGSKIIFGDEEKLLDTIRTYSINQNYFGLGVIFKINTERFFVGGGLSFQLLSTASLKFESLETDVKNKFQNYDIISFFNAGYKIPIGAPIIFFELRYIQGLVNINTDNNQNTENYLSNFKSKGLKFLTGIMFPL